MSRPALASTAAAALPPVTEEQLLLAFRHLRRPGWPTTLELALQDPARAGCIQGWARQMNRQRFISSHLGPRSVPTGQPVPPTPTAPPPRQLLARGPAFDARRAAANDRDD